MWNSGIDGGTCEIVERGGKLWNSGIVEIDGKPVK